MSPPRSSAGTLLGLTTLVVAGVWVAWTLRGHYLPEVDARVNAIADHFHLVPPS